jgi:hypothetical protein
VGTARGRAGLELESGAAQGRGNPIGGPRLSAREGEKGAGAGSLGRDGGMGRARGEEKEGEGGPRPAGSWGKERREKREVGRLGWAQGRKEGWGERENVTVHVPVN